MTNRYGLPNTIYTDVKTWDLFEMYRQDVWNNLSNNERNNLLQETSNRISIYNDGEMRTSVNFNDRMPPYLLGSQSGSFINMNQNIFAQSTIETDTGQCASDNNWRALETVLHESRHVWQDAMADGNIPADNETKMRISANGLDVTNVNRLPASPYLAGVKHGDLYYLNPTELDAHAFSQEMTSQIMDRVRERYGEDESMRIYSDRLEQTGYASKLSELQRTYGGNAELDVSNSLINHYYGTHIPISNPEVNEMVEEEMIATHEHFSGGQHQSCNDTDVFDNSDNLTNREETSDLDKIRECDTSDFTIDSENDISLNDQSSIKSDLEMMHDAENSDDCDYDDAASYTPSEYSHDTGNSDLTNYTGSISNSNSSSNSSSSDCPDTNNHTSNSSTDDSNEQSSGMSM